MITVTKGAVSGTLLGTVAVLTKALASLVRSVSVLRTGQNRWCGAHQGGGLRPWENQQGQKKDTAWGGTVLLCYLCRLETACKFHDSRSIFKQKETKEQISFVPTGHFRVLPSVRD